MTFHICCPPSRASQIPECSSFINEVIDRSVYVHHPSCRAPYFISMVLFANPASAAQPRLVVFISIDQMRADHLERYARAYTAGFKTLMSEGTTFTNAGLNYAGSSTGPGHATLSTGVYPWKSGIVSNNWRDRETKAKVYCVDDSTALPVEGEGGGRSSKNLMATAIGDWLQAASPASRVVSLSYKDRAAILMGGKNPHMLSGMIAAPDIW